MPAVLAIPSAPRLKAAAALETYRTRTTASIAQYGGPYLVWSGPIEAPVRGLGASALAMLDEALRRILIVVDGISAA